MTTTLTNEKQSSVRRVLIYRLGSLGDTLVALPALHLVARAFPKAERRMLTNVPVNVKAPPAAAILEHAGLVDGYFRYTVGTRSLGDLARLWWTLFRWRPDVLVYLGSARGVDSARRDENFFRFCGIRHAIGIPVTEAMQRNHWDDATQTFEPEAARLVRNIAQLGDGHLGDPESWDLHLTKEELARADGALGSLVSKPLIAVSVGTKVQSKDWGRENWRALLGRLATIYPDHALALSGAAEESDTSEFAAEGWRQAGGGEVVNLCGRLKPRESAAAFRRARIFIGHDSGPMHLAAAVQTPCVAIFAARNKPRVWFPYGRRHRVVYHQTECWGCGLETCIVEKKRCLTSIRVDEVVEQIRALLD
ncbi:glycosyltransferase family 9 protein [Edaphobacter modestus]|uniref:ADP-heptose:LPS heptosyltransferase n=1 Tax=Edaphobacter modestus TaxID=388466 RepID=A0A4Q7YRZ3_9BACT|nr:glycosyltransferase family 9 protein [Edaphobacter modestus]RZU39639.1 ADP-heptose:LPS heptosyltransferase [Edaphobacter modestus]